MGKFRRQSRAQAAGAIQKAQSEITLTATFWSSIISFIARIGADTCDPDELRQQKRTLMLYTAAIFWAGPVWGSLYLAFGEFTAALIPYSYGVLSALSIFIFARTRSYAFFRFAQLLIILLLPFFLQLALGGFINSSAVVVWSLVAPIVALVFAGPRQALVWFGAYLALLAVSGAAQGFVRASNNLPPALVILFFVLNLAAVSATAFVLLTYFISQRNKAFALLRVEEEKSKNLLLNILPAEIALILKETNGASVIADSYDDVSILFADMVNFTPLSAQLPPREMVGMLNQIFSHFDTLVDTYGVEKIETVGDEYMAACGVPRVCADHAARVTRLALAMREYIAACPEFAGRKLQIRIGIHSGAIVAGVIGKKKFAFELFGDTVNTANRMQSHGAPGKIHITRETRELLDGEFICEPRGVIDVKGKGEMETWFVVGARSL